MMRWGLIVGAVVWSLGACSETPPEATGDPEPDALARPEPETPAAEASAPDGGPEPSPETSPSGAPSADTLDGPDGDGGAVPESGADADDDDVAAEPIDAMPDGEVGEEDVAEASEAETEETEDGDDPGDVADAQEAEPPPAICEPLEPRCLGQEAQKCLPDGTGWLTWKTCAPSQVCTEEGCCTIQCKSKACGGDGCGGSCGSCQEGADCEDGVCVVPCQPDCFGKTCGGDGCGGSCGTCDPLDTCDVIDGLCQPCKPKCAGKVCGDNGCAGTCGECPQGKVCDDGLCVAPKCPGYPWDTAAGDDCCRLDDPCSQGDDGLCQCEGKCSWDSLDCITCIPKCGGKECGLDGCGGTCGACAGDQVCVSQQCISPVCPGYSGTEPCCKTDDPCGWGGDAVCDCGGTCPWDSGDCPNCVSICSFAECGPDGCGASCGTCSPEFECVGGECKPGPCPGYEGNDPCCKVDDPCNQIFDFKCQCGFECSWDVPDCTLACESEEGCQPPPPCESNCDNQECGWDGCFGTCGECPGDQSCVDGQCFAPTCSGYPCFDDDCCAEDNPCGLANNGVCECEAHCGWDAADCAPPACAPSCACKDCGSDGCGGSCGTCELGINCLGGLCDQPFCAGYSGTEGCCKIHNPCEWELDGICDCGGSCGWDEVDCPVAVCGNGTCESAETPQSCPEDC